MSEFPTDSGEMSFMILILKYSLKQYVGKTVGVNIDVNVWEGRKNIRHSLSLSSRV